MRPDFAGNTNPCSYFTSNPSYIDPSYTIQALLNIQNYSFSSNAHRQAIQSLWDISMVSKVTLTAM
jgi:hypothetical protein